MKKKVCSLLLALVMLLSLVPVAAVADELEEVAGGIGEYTKLKRAVDKLFGSQDHMDEDVINTSSTFLKDNPLGGLESEDFSASDDM